MVNYKVLTNVQCIVLCLPGEEPKFTEEVVYGRNKRKQFEW